MKASRLALAFLAIMGMMMLVLGTAPAQAASKGASGKVCTVKKVKVKATKLKKGKKVKVTKFKKVKKCTQAKVKAAPQATATPVTVAPTLFSHVLKGGEFQGEVRLGHAYRLPAGATVAAPADGVSSLVSTMDRAGKAVETLVMDHGVINGSHVVTTYTNLDTPLISRTHKAGAPLGQASATDLVVTLLIDGQEVSPKGLLFN